MSLRSSSQHLPDLINSLLNAIGSNCELNPLQTTCNLLDVPLGHIADPEMDPATRYTLLRRPNATSSMKI